jgi:hypothetical protein
MFRLLLAALILNVVSAESLSVDYWRTLNLSKRTHLRGGWIAKDGNELLVNVVTAASPSPKPSQPPGPSEDFTLLRHKAKGFPINHPVNRNYK